MLVLTRSDISNVLAIEDVINAVEAAHAAVALGEAAEGSRSALSLPGTDAVLIPMTAAIGPLHSSGLKLLTDSPANPDSALPRQQSVILLLDPRTNAVEAILDGAEITTLRTAAASAVATRHLARADSSTLGLIGAGALARTHLRAIRTVRPIRRVLVWSRSAATLADFVADSADSGLEIVVADSVREVAAQADVVCTLTPARTPILHGAWLADGVHVNAVGAPPRPDYREIDTDVIRTSRVIVDSRSIALAESGAIRLAVESGSVDLGHVGDELGQVIAGQRTGRHDSAQRTLFNSVGMAIQDLATARLLVDVAREKGLGIDIALNARAQESLTQPPAARL